MRHADRQHGRRNYLHTGGGQYMVSHRILLRGLGPLSSGGEPVLLQRTDQELIPVLLDQLQADGGLDSVEATVLPKAYDRGPLRLFQPVQRTFYIALFEAVCELPGYPRVDPAAIDSAGMVIRRIGAGGTEQRWLSQQSSLRGWLDVDAAAVDEDPDPQQRSQLTTGSSELDRQIALLRQATSPLTEATAPLFVAPPAVCEKLGKTVLYGIVPVTSNEFSERPVAGVIAPNRSSTTYTDKVIKHLPSPLSTDRSNLPLTGRVLTKDDVLAAVNGNDGQVLNLINVVRQIVVELDAFGQSPESVALLAEISTIQLVLLDGSKQGMGDFLRHATSVLLETNPGQVVLPVAWPTISAAQSHRINQLALGLLAMKVVADEQGEQRFAKPGARYYMRGFVRVNRNPECPPMLFWSAPSSPYQIAPWYEDAKTGLPLPKIELPDPFDADVRSNFKPNVSFRVPDKLFSKMNAIDPKKLFKGEEDDSVGSMGLDWICSFSIPIITICAFFVLNIFLSLFDLFFHWMLLIKICIPVPKKT